MQIKSYFEVMIAVGNITALGNTTYHVRHILLQLCSSDKAFTSGPCTLLQNYHVWGDSQFVRAESGFLESSSTINVIQNLMIPNTRIWIGTQTKHFPTGYTIWPLSQERGRIEDENEKEKV